MSQRAYGSGVSRREFLGAALAGGTAITVGGLLPGAAVARSPRLGRTARHVVLVDWDGFDPDYLGRVATPNIDALAERGSLSTARCSYRSISNPSRATMSTGAYPEVHGNVAYVYDPATGIAQGQSRALEAETIAERLAAEGRTVASVQWYMVQDHGTSYGDPEHLYWERAPRRARRAARWSEPDPSGTAIAVHGRRQRTVTGPAHAFDTDPGPADMNRHKRYTCFQD